MKDIDFLPEWYKSGIRREVSYRTQYIAMGGIFLAMAVWSLATSHSISKARAEFGDMAPIHEKAESASSPRGSSNAIIHTPRGDRDGLAIARSAATLLQLVSC